MLNNLLTSLVIASLLTWRAPYILTSLKVRSETQQKNINIQSFPTSFLGRCCHSCYMYILSIRLRRKGLLMTSLQLSVGWIWESSISDLFDLTGANTKIKVGVKVVLYILLAMCFSIILIVIHLYVRNWSTGEYDDDSALLYLDNNNYDDDSNNNDNNCEHHQEQISGQQQQQHEQLSGLQLQQQQQQQQQQQFKV